MLLRVVYVISKFLDCKNYKEWYLICFEEEEVEVGEDDL